LTTTGPDQRPSAASSAGSVCGECGSAQVELVEGASDDLIGRVGPDGGCDLLAAARQRHQARFIGAEDDVIAPLAHGGGDVGDESVLVLGAFADLVMAPGVPGKACEARLVGARPDLEARGREGTDGDQCGPVAGLVDEEGAHPLSLFEPSPALREGSRRSSRSQGSSTMVSIMSP
jgi:hypothetical protein